MKTYTKDELKTILDNHKKWISNEGGERTDLSYSNLSYSNLRGSDLSYSNLRGSDLSYSNLRDSNLSDSDLRGSNLSGSDLRGSDLSDSDLRDSDLSGSNLSDSNLSGTILPSFQICEGDLIVWKKARDDRLVRLKIPAEAKRTASLIGRKCRAEYAIVVAITNATGKTFQDAISQHDKSVTYRVGETIRPDSYNDDIRIECANGVHFFQTRKEAEDYFL